jgi:putative membrane protein
VSASSTRPALLTLSAVLAAATVLAQIAYPLTTGESLRRLTVTTVVCFAAASVTHAIATRGVRWGLTLLAVAGGIGLCAEAVGVRTGMPFGRYAYADSLGSKLLDVPVIVPLAWVMMSYPCLLLGRRLGHDRTLLVALSGGLTLAAWDLFLDPQMVAAGHWAWAYPDPALPGIPGIPITNFAGWAVVGVVMIGALDAVLPRQRATETVPAALLAWTWIGSTVGSAVFFGRPSVAVWGGVAMGICTAPYLLSLRRQRL